MTRRYTSALQVLSAVVFLITVGYCAMLVLNGNPLENIKLIEEPDNSLAVVMKDGRLHKNTLRS